MSYNLSIVIELAPTDIGLTLNAQLLDSAGSPSGSTITTGIYEIDTGFYGITVELADDFAGSIRLFDSASTAVTLATVAINPQPDVTINNITLSDTVVGGIITIIRGDTFLYTYTTIYENIPSRTNLIFSIKNDPSDIESASIIRLSESAGLEIVNGSVVGFTSSQGSISVTTDSLRFFVNIQLDAPITAMLDNLTGAKFYDIEVITASLVKTLIIGEVFVVYAVS